MGEHGELDDIDEAKMKNIYKKRMKKLFHSLKMK